MAVDVDDEDFDYLKESLKLQEEILREQRDRARQMVGREQMVRGTAAIAIGVAITTISYITDVVLAGEASYVVATGFLLYGAYQLARGIAAKTRE